MRITLMCLGRIALDKIRSKSQDDINEDADGL